MKPASSRLEEEDDGTAPHHYGPCDEFYYILYGEFTVWWGKDAANLDEFYELKEATARITRRAGSTR